MKVWNVIFLRTIVLVDRVFEYHFCVQVSAFTCLNESLDYYLPLYDCAGVSCVRISFFVFRFLRLCA